MADGVSSGPEFAALYEHAACGLLITAEDGRIDHANATFCQWIGSAREELVGQRKLQELLTMGGRIFHQTHWSPLLRIQGTIAEVKLDLIHHDGHCFPVLMNAVRREHAGAIRHEIAVFVAEDRQRYEREFVIARKRAEELLASEREAQLKLSAAQAELKLQHEAAEDRASFAEQMVGIVSHDLRNPLMAIHASAAVLARGDLSPRQRRAAEAIDRSVSRSKKLIEDLLDFTQARIGGGLRVQLREVALHQVVAEIVDELRLAYPNRQIVLVPVGEGAVFADEDRLAQIVSNLVANAIAYGDPRSDVTVSTLIEPHQALLRVHNLGPRIPQERLPTIFSAMTRANSAGSSHSVGLGLFIVQEIARAHRGSVGVVSSDAQGTTFTITVPRESISN